MVHTQSTEWMVVPGFPSYSVSNVGEVKRTAQGLQPWSVPGRVLKHEIDKDGHHRVSLFREGTKKRIFVHRIVCEAWHGPAQADKPLVLHKDDDKDNNAPDNLYWGDAKDNGRDSHKNGRSVRGERVNTARLNEEQIISIRYRAFNGETNVSLAEEFGIADASISSIVRGRNWKHVGGPIVRTSRRGRNQNPANDNGARRAAA